jgi:M6 family metalloprotease-like protein
MRRTWHFVILALLVVMAALFAGGRTALQNNMAWTRYRVPANQQTAVPEGYSPAFTAGATAAEVAAQMAAYTRRLDQQSMPVPDPIAARALLAREKALLNGAGFATAAFGDDEYLGQPPKALMGVITNFQPAPGGDIVTRPYPVDPANPDLGCSEQQFTFGPLKLGDDPAPGQGDNFTFHKANLTLDDYRAAIFKTGPASGYGTVRIDLGRINLFGYSLNNYLLEMNQSGTYQVAGDILPEALTLSHAQEFYGYAVYSQTATGRCVAPLFSDGQRDLYVTDTLQALATRYDGDPAVDWSLFDANGDKIIDLLFILHAGYGFQEGGGEDRLNTRSGAFATPVQVAGLKTPGATGDDYYVKSYLVLPEFLDVGAIQEEFENQFGLADYYTLDTHNSNSFWTSQSLGVWGGPLGGGRPVGSSLHQNWLLGRKKPAILNWEDIPSRDSGQAGDLTVTIGRTIDTPEGSSEGVIVRLPAPGGALNGQAGAAAGSERYYLLEWRDDNGFDRSLNDPYWVRYQKWSSPPPAMHVDRLSATTPGLIISYRDQAQPFDYNLTDSSFTGPSIGPKFAHLVVDARPFPQQWDTPDPNRASLTGRNLGQRVTAGDAAFGLLTSRAWSASYDFDPAGTPPTESKSWKGRPPVPAFHDSYGYFPGFFYDPTGQVYYLWDPGASAVLPAKGVYSTRVTDLNGELRTDQFDKSIGGLPLGTGNPGDDHVHYGLHVEVLESQAEYGVVRIWRSLYETKLYAGIDMAEEVGGTGDMAFRIDENIGGKLEKPRLVVTLPPGLRYVPGSAGAGWTPVSGTAAATAGQMVWTGNDIGTGTAVDLGGFQVETLSGAGALVQVDLYRQDTIPVQSLKIAVGTPPTAVFVPLIRR